MKRFSSSPSHFSPAFDSAICSNRADCETTDSRVLLPVSSDFPSLSRSPQFSFYANHIHAFKLFIQPAAAAWILGPCLEGEGGVLGWQQQQPAQQESHVVTLNCIKGHNIS
jgi:hypothetical protein